MPEVFKVIARCKTYEISESGVIRNVKTGTIRKLSVKNGYLFIKFPGTKKGKPKNFYIHRLVAETFLPRPRPLFRYNYVNHKSLDKFDNHYTNLEWVSQAENIQHYYRNKRLSEELGLEAPFEPKFA